MADYCSLKTTAEIRSLNLICAINLFNSLGALACLCLVCLGTCQCRCTLGVRLVFIGSHYWKGNHLFCIGNEAKLAKQNVQSKRRISAAKIVH